MERRSFLRLIGGVIAAWFCLPAETPAHYVPPLPAPDDWLFDGDLSRSVFISTLQGQDGTLYRTTEYGSNCGEGHVVEVSHDGKLIAVGRIKD